MSPSLLRTAPSTWRFALIGALASLPVAAIVNWLPNSEATVGGGIMVIGAFIAGAIAAVRSTDPDDAGLRAGFLGGVLAVLTLVVTVVSAAVGGTAAAWPPSRVLFWVLAIGLVLCVSPVFGLACGRVGGWVADTVASRRKTGANAP
ncbi:DUF5518 domain-containing protein [Halorarum halophilum]|uniref:DUF5518 domain-containing protein n=1 Tax=Halorarum halophilum TaxID=2743090 RepID=A0A7D5GLW5_9EURY|nr:DUF5518 domain-containing protein [Halobaculum halophilum]QLG28327.1 DUF5518 domain-containing protein [Halobaculum halophilum]